MIKLAMIPERTPVKLTIAISPDLNADLIAYAELYRATYGREESLAELVPAIVSAFLTGDRAFGHSRRAAGK
jgi:hypothetical protein